MKKQVFFIHGGDSYTDRADFLAYLKTATIRDLPGKDTKELWTKNLALELGDECEFFAPRMPNSQNANYEEWSIWFERHFEYLKDGVVLIGWSLGGMFLVKYLSENKCPFSLAQVHLIAAPYGTIDAEDGDDCGNFQFEPKILSNLANLANLATLIYLWHSKDDFVVPYEHALQYQKHLPGATLTSFEDKNHFIIQEFNELLQVIKP